MTKRFPGESPAYRLARDQLLLQELQLRRLTESVAAQRRQLPPGGLVPQDYVFQTVQADGNVADVRLSQLFAPGKPTLAVYHFMFPRSSSDSRLGPQSGESARLPLTESPCPSCTALIDQLEGAAQHVQQRVNLVIVARAAPRVLHTFGQERGWRTLPLLSCAANSFNADYHGETPTGSQMPMLNVFHKEGEAIRHFWGAELLFAPTDPGQEYRHVGTLEPLWNLFDLTPEGRGSDWDEQLSYSCCGTRNS